MTAEATTSNGNGSLKAELLSAAIKQGPSFVVLCGILYGIYYFADYAMRTAVPAHLQQIQSGYEKIASDNKAMIEAHARVVEKQFTQYDQAIETTKELNRSLQQLVKQGERTP
ncbi:MAG: hypothetical protein A3E01_02875 [Gammaproteobacteria bacterium RIFCSPHIGHO2_12_FULL_63_22]|nr:MAG: hypothetical protein A3E01_02875 [Gammaproteobacteria bacterium RIFCSPHIGHO2_12_FULL_63_22]